MNARVRLPINQAAPIIDLAHTMHDEADRTGEPAKRVEVEVTLKYRGLLSRVVNFGGFRHNGEEIPAELDIEAEDGFPETFVTIVAVR